MLSFLFMCFHEWSFFPIHSFSWNWLFAIHLSIFTLKPKYNHFYSIFFQNWSQFILKSFHFIFSFLELAFSLLADTPIEVYFRMMNFLPGLTQIMYLAITIILSLIFLFRLMSLSLQLHLGWWRRIFMLHFILCLFCQNHRKILNIRRIFHEKFK
jgi:hypothetical protein